MDIKKKYIESKNIMRVSPEFRNYVYALNRKLEEEFNKKINLTTTTKIIFDFVNEEKLLKKYDKKKYK